jgi:hypothetical protein
MAYLCGAALHQTVGTEQQSLRKTVYLFLFVRFLINTEKAK